MKTYYKKVELGVIRHKRMKCPYCNETVDVKVNYSLKYDKDSKPEEFLELEPIEPLKVDKKILKRIFGISFMFLFVEGLSFMATI